MVACSSPWEFLFVIGPSSISLHEKEFNQMNSYPHRPSRASAFTLVELLTVIAIIAILMGLLFPAISMVQNSARKAEARSAASAIVTAVKAYNTEYGKFPNPTSSTPPTNTTAQDLIVGDTGEGGASSSNAELFNVLRSKATGVNTNYVLNPRRVVFYEGKVAANPAAPKSGFADGAAGGGAGITAGALYDPWGSEYCIAIDQDYDNQLSNLPYADFKGTPGATGSSNKAPQTSAGVYSLGKDGKLGSKDTSKNYRSGSTLSDDIVTWQQ
jgi:prepilin-type N-terminal cleavage/methylation domain-containing protein